MPRHYQEAMRRPDAEQWQKACEKEYQCIMKNQTYDLVPRDSLPPEANVLGNTWVFKIKPGMLYRARLCVRGDWQIEGVDFFEVFAPTARLQSFRILLHLGAAYDLKIEQVDFETAFMNGDLEEDVYMRQIPGFVDQDNPTHVCKLKKALNGIRQAPRQWFAKLKESLLQMGYTQSKFDPTMMYRLDSNSCFFILIFVDDLLIAASHSEENATIQADTRQQIRHQRLGRSHHLSWN